MVLSADIPVFEHLGFKIFSATARGRSHLFARKAHDLMQSCHPRNWNSGFEGKINYFETLKEILDLVTLVLRSEEKKKTFWEEIKPKYYEEENSIQNYLV